MGDRDMLRGWFWQGRDEAVKDLCWGGDFEKYMRLPKPVLLTEQLEQQEGHVSSHNLQGFTNLRDQVMNFGRRAGAAYVGSMGDRTYKAWRQKCGAP